MTEKSYYSGAVLHLDEDVKPFVDIDGAAMPRRALTAPPPRPRPSPPTRDGFLIPEGFRQHRLMFDGDRPAPDRQERL